MPIFPGKNTKVTIEDATGTKTVFGAVGDVKITPLARDSSNLAVSFVAYSTLTDPSVTLADQPKFTADDELNTAPKSWWSREKELQEIQAREKKQKEAQLQAAIDKAFGPKFKPKQITLITPDNRFVLVDADDPSMPFWINGMGYKVYEEVKDSISLAPFPELSIRGADMELLKEFREIRRVSTPWVLCQTADYRVLGRDLMEIAQTSRGSGLPMPIVAWDCVRGHFGFNQPDGESAARTFGDVQETISAPAAFLSKALENLPANGIALMVFPTNEMLQEPLVAQAIANVRDPFKSDGRTLVMIGNLGLEAPPLVKDDIPVLREELPGKTRIIETIQRLSKDAKGELPKQQVEEAVPLCLGLAPFMIEEGVARKLRKKDGKLDLDLKGLAELQKDMVEQSTGRALMFQKEDWSFDEIGGLSQFKKFMLALKQGPLPPQVIVQFDEIDKSISAASAGAVADNTGTSQDQLKVLLTYMERNNWTGCLLAGGPGTGKTLATICTGNALNCRTLLGDLGATKASLLGESERKIRLMMEVLKAIGGENVLFLATANRLDTLPPELQRRFSLGTWYFAPPNALERKAIWKIQMDRNKIEEQKLPDDTGWVGSDIRNCCRLAWRTRLSLKEASQMISLAGRSAAKDIARLEILAEEGGWLSANYPGSYQRDREEGKKGKVERRMAL